LTSAFGFHVDGVDGDARAGVIETARGAVPTPAFMPVGTLGTVKSLSPFEVARSGTRLLIANTYHLWLRPGLETIEAHGGLHEFMRWPHAIATDSGGYQAFSLAGFRTLTEDGFEFASHLDGSRRFLSPEEAMRIQGVLGSDIAMQLDVCPKAGADSPEVERAVDLTTRWAKRCLLARKAGQALFGIVQGGTNVELRRRHAAALAALPLDGLALGGFSVGEPAPEMHRTLSKVVPGLPAARPRYLMGGGTPADLVRAIRVGIDLFDCVLPTRNARNGQAFVASGRLVIKNARYRNDCLPLDPGCRCPVCSGGFTRSYVRHLYLAGEILAHRLLSEHNLHFYQSLVGRARNAVLCGDFAGWSSSELERLGSQGEPDGVLDDTELGEAPIVAQEESSSPRIRGDTDK